MGLNIPKASAYGGILLTRTGKILLREPANHYDGYVWTFAKGRPEPGDTPEQTALREVLEETGYHAEIVDVLPGLYQGGTSSNAFFVMRHMSPQGHLHWETQATRWVSFTEAEHLIGETTNSKGQIRDLAILKAAKIWFEANPDSYLPDIDQAPHKAAVKSDWNTQDMPAEHTTVKLDFVLTEKQADRVRLGLIPKEMEDKWFAYFADNTLFQHRSWTGVCIDQIHFVAEGPALRATHAEVNRDPRQYGLADDYADARRITEMVLQLASLPSDISEIGSVAS